MCCTILSLRDEKVLIADDRVAIVGSANINDRSMLGDRDTEVMSHPGNRVLSCFNVMNGSGGHPYRGHISCGDALGRTTVGSRLCTT